LRKDDPNEELVILEGADVWVPDLIAEPRRCVPLPERLRLRETQRRNPSQGKMIMHWGSYDCMDRATAALRSLPLAAGSRQLRRHQ
jgi:hypothetical protein